MQKNKIFYISLFALSVLLLCITIFTGKNFGINISIEQIILVLTAHAEQLSDSYKETLFRYFYQSLIWWLIAVIIYSILCTKIKNILIIKIIKISTLFLFFSTCLYFDNVYQISGFLNAKNIDSNYIEENYSTDINSITWDKKQNLVLIIAESLENTFANKDLFENSLIPKLSKLQEENIAFNTHMQTHGASWTIGGITAYLFGIPLKLPPFIHGNKINSFYDDFIPYAESIFIPMEKAQYDISFFSNWDTNFSGYNILIKQHSNGINFDELYYKQFDDIKSIKGKKGLYNDAFILDQAVQYMQNNIHKNNNPFALIISTLDTHVPANGKDFLKLDEEITTFIEKIQKIDNKNTTIIVVGDHLLMQKEIDNVELVDRSIFNLIINPAHPPVQDRNNRIFTSIDFAPTILEAIGANLPHRQFGLGISLFSEKQTLLEKDFDLYNKEIRKDSNFYNSFF